MKSLIALASSFTLVILSSCGKSDRTPGASAPGSSSSSAGASAPSADKGPADVPPKGPATVAEATRTLDLTTFPLMNGAETDPEPQRSTANLSYSVKGDVKSAYDAVSKQLTSSRWKYLADASSVSDQASAGTFVRNTFYLSLSVYPGSKPGAVSVMINNHGNADLAKLPLPPKLTTVYAGPLTAMYTTEEPVTATAETCRKLLTAQGWEPYGSAGNSSYFKQNAVRLGITVSSAPAQGGKTMISLMSEQMSADIPAPTDAQDIRYADSTKRMDYETAADEKTVDAYYRKTLGKTDWKATLEKPIKIDNKDMVIFRNPPMDMMTLEMAPGGDGKTKVTVHFQTRAEIDELDRLIKEKADAAKKAKEQQK